MIKTTNARYNHPVSSSNYLPSRIKAILKYQDLSCHNLINTCTQIQNKKLLIIRKNVKNNSVLRISHQKMINVAPQNFSSGSHNGQLPMAHNQLVRILNCRSRLKCRAPGSLLEVNGDKEETLRTSKCWVIIGTNVNQFVFNVVLPQAISFTQKDKYGKWKVIWCQWPARNRSE